MTFDITTFGPVGGQASRGKAPQVWSHQTTDAATAIDASGYFDAASELLQVGDHIHSTILTASVPTGFAIHVVVSNASGVVDTSNAVVTVTSLTDSD